MAETGSQSLGPSESALWATGLAPRSRHVTETLDSWVPPLSSSSRVRWLRATYVPLPPEVAAWLGREVPVVRVALAATKKIGIRVSLASETAPSAKP